MCVILPNKWVKFIFWHKFCKGMCCLLEKFTQLEKIYTTAGCDGRDKFQVCSLLRVSPRKSNTNHFFKYGQNWRQIWQKIRGIFYYCQHWFFQHWRLCQCFSMSICESKFFNVNVSANDAKRTAGGRVQAGHLLGACLSHLTYTYKPHPSPESMETFGRHFSCAVF